MLKINNRMPGRPSKRSPESYKRPKKPKEYETSQADSTKDDDFDASDRFGIKRASYDYMPIVSKVLESGGDVFVCQLRENRKKREISNQCPHCGAPLDIRRSYTACPVCRGGIRDHRKEGPRKPSNRPKEHETIGPQHSKKRK